MRLSGVGMLKSRRLRIMVESPLPEQALLVGLGDQINGGEQISKDPERLSARPCKAGPLFGLHFHEVTSPTKRAPVRHGGAGPPWCVWNAITTNKKATPSDGRDAETYVCQRARQAA